MGTRMGDGVIFVCITEKHAHPLIKISFPKYYLEVHMQKTGELHYHTWQIAKHVLVTHL